jgi:hypothetical protein
MFIIMKKKISGKAKKTSVVARKKKNGKPTFVVADATQCFWVNNGPVLKDLKELAEALKMISEEQFAYHVSGDRNDFASWVNDILRDATCAKALRGAKNQSAAQKAVAKRLSAYK